MSPGLRGFLSSASVRHQSRYVKDKQVCAGPVAPLQERKLLLFTGQLVDLPLTTHASSPEEFRMQESSAVVSQQGPRIRTCHKELKAISHCALWLHKDHRGLKGSQLSCYQTALWPEIFQRWEPPA